MDIEDMRGIVMSRRSALKRTGGLALLLSQAAFLEQAFIAPARPALAATGFTDIQFEIGQFFAPGTYAGVTTQNDGAGPVVVSYGPIYALFTPIKLTRTPTKADQATLASALSKIEANFDASASGLLIPGVSYGLPYFNRLPASLVAAHMPRLTQDTSRFVLENAVAGPTDVVGGVVQGVQNPPPKERFNINVVLEQNDMLLHMRSDSMANLTNALAWLQGSNNLHGQVLASPNFNGLLAFQASRVQFQQPGMPRRVADQAAAAHPDFYEFHSRINPNSPMNMGFTDQHLNSNAPNAATVTFAGDPGNTLTQAFTTAKPGDYFDNGSTCHFSHVIEDLYQFYQTPGQDPTGGGEPFSERCQYMFRSNQTGSGSFQFFGLPAQPNADEFTNGGGPAFVNNVFQGTNAAFLGAQAADGQATQQINQDLSATFTGEQRIGHESALQQTSRLADGTPFHIRMDSPGFDGMDVPAFNTFPGQSIGVPVPAGTSQFKLQFIIFMPTSESFRQIRVSMGAQNLFAQFGQPADPNGVQFSDNGLERFLTATRRQNFLVPPRRNRAFPLVELA